MYAELAPKLFANGWRNLLPLGVYSTGRRAPNPKACMLKKWNLRSIEPMTEEHLRYAVARFPSAGIGCAFGAVHGVVAIDVDVDDGRQNALVRDVVRETLPFTELQRFGRSPKFLLLYRGDVRSSKHLGIGIEIFGTSGQTVLYGIHPKTGKPYYWPQKSPLDASPKDLPPITQEQVNEFLRTCGEVIESCAHERSRANRPLGHEDLRTTLANERRIDGANGAARQLMRLHKGQRHLVLLSVTGWLVAKGYTPREIADFVDDFFPAHLRDEEWEDVRGYAMAMAEAAIKKYGDKDWELKDE